MEAVKRNRQIDVTIDAATRSLLTTVTDAGGVVNTLAGPEILPNSVVYDLGGAANMQITFDSMGRPLNPPQVVTLHYRWRPGACRDRALDRSSDGAVRTPMTTPMPDSSSERGFGLIEALIATVRHRRGRAVGGGPVHGRCSHAAERQGQLERRALVTAELERIRTLAPTALERTDGGSLGPTTEPQRPARDDQAALGHHQQAERLRAHRRRARRGGRVRQGRPGGGDFHQRAGGLPGGQQHPVPLRSRHDVTDPARGLRIEP